VSVLTRIAVGIGGVALLAATAIDTLAVIGRNLGLPIIGSIELIQAAVLVSGVIGLVLASAHDDHARVRIMTDKLRRGRALADFVGAISLALLFAAMLAGSLWLAADLWHGHERSELLGVPWKVLRLVVNVGLAVSIIVVLASLVRRSRR
jgi:TRAP-type C4-dicarboxylate transport system permease small subunit